MSAWVIRGAASPIKRGKQAVGPRIMIGVKMSRCPHRPLHFPRLGHFLPRYSGESAAISPAERTPTIRYPSMFTKADALAAVDTVQPHARQRRDAGQRDSSCRAYSSRTRKSTGSGNCCERGAGGRSAAEAQFLAFEIAQFLIDREASDSGL